MINSGFKVHNGMVGILLAAGALFGVEVVSAQEPVKEMFQQKCAACHSIGGGRLVGPDLAGVGDRRTESWLLNFIRSSQAMVASGDPVAKALFEEFRVVMPDQALSDDQIKQILAYIKAGGGASAVSMPVAETAAPEPTQEEIVRGQNLFQGTLRFANGGPSCISCHNVTNDAVIGGGILAKELTTVFSRLGAPGIRAILTSPPFPVMQAAYERQPFGEDEIRALIGFLQHADRENTLHQPREYGWALFLGGSGGVGILLGFYLVIGRRRKRRSVNQDIYDRQVKSQ